MTKKFVSALAEAAGGVPWRVKASDGVKVVDDSSPRMLLVEGPKAAVEAIAGSLADWVVSEERTVKAAPQPVGRASAAGSASSAGSAGTRRSAASAGAIEAHVHDAEPDRRQRVRAGAGQRRLLRRAPQGPFGDDVFERVDASRTNTGRSARSPPAGAARWSDGGNGLRVPAEVRIRVRVDHHDRDAPQAADGRRGPGRGARLELLELLDEEPQAEIASG